MPSPISLAILGLSGTHNSIAKPSKSKFHSQRYEKCKIWKEWKKAGKLMGEVVGAAGGGKEEVV